jgi:hypothetical protein
MTHAEIINCWPTLSDFADDVAVAYGTAKAMRRRDSIPSEHWIAVVAGAQQRGISGINLEALAQAAAARLEVSE